MYARVSHIIQLNHDHPYILIFLIRSYLCNMPVGREEQEKLTGNRVDKGSFFRIKIIVKDVYKRQLQLF